MKIVYDVIIVGCGPAGMACGITLARSGLNCLILESKPDIGSKVCGDALSIDGVKNLESVGLNVNELISAGGREICFHEIYCDGKIIDKSRFCDGNALGISRNVFDNLVLDNVLRAGVQVMFGQTVTKIEKSNGEYCVNDTYYASEVVLAAGAAGAVHFGGYPATEIPLGISARIKCRISLKEDCFYIYRDSAYAGGYAWVFPVGDDLWNIGVWTPDNKVKWNLMKEYEAFESRIVHQVTSVFSYDRKPRGALIGAFDKNKPYRETVGWNHTPECRVIGDNALRASIYSGEGIKMAMQSGVLEAQRILG